MREGWDWSGIETIRSWAKPPEESYIRPMYPPQPSMDQCFGPYHPNDHVLRRQDMDALRVYRKVPTNTSIGDFVDPWAEPLFDVVNEMVLSYLELRVVPRMRNQISLAAACEALFPPSSRSGPLETGDAFYHTSFLNANEEGIPNLDYAFVAGRIKAFLSRFEDESTKFEDECIAGITRVIARMFVEVFELASNNSAGNGRTKILPCDIRTQTFQMDELRRVLQFSQVFWNGRTAP